ncbi:hypothetical protein E2C01_012435 [Portunus trituberculatus]|uniref:Uncharacterized protein n=1 Tax=Portunus trituberculatus TaxID=210409 RepID=A0A5B7DDR0_PORTR|nr:hypothetical protein [Portunus trituberculatus]
MKEFSYQFVQEQVWQGQYERLEAKDSVPVSRAERHRMTDTGRKRRLARTQTLMSIEAAKSEPVGRLELPDTEGHILKRSTLSP